MGNREGNQDQEIIIVETERTAEREKVKQY